MGLCHFDLGSDHTIECSHIFYSLSNLKEGILVEQMTHLHFLMKILHFL